MAKVRIKKLPEGYKIKGGKVAKTSSPAVSRTGDQSDFGLTTFTGNLNINNAGPFSSVNKTLTAEPRDESNLEAERGETALTDLNNDGAFELYNIGGNRHSSGGTPLNLPPQSFIYSDTRSMKLNRNELLEMGVSSKKKITPAKVSKKYDLNDYIALLNDPDSDSITVDTAEYMLDKNKNKLSQLAFIQERKKEFNEGVPLAAYPYIKKKGANPIEFSQAVENISEKEAVAKSMMQMPASMQEKVMQLQQVFSQIDDINDPNQADIDTANRQEIAPHQEQSPPQLNPIPVPPMEQQNLEMMARYGSELPQAGWGKSFLDWSQKGLAVAGMVPGIGNIADAANTAISGGRAAYAGLTGDTEGAKKHTTAMGLNALAMVPGVGQMSQAARGVKGATNIVKAVGKGALKESGDLIGKGVIDTGKNVAQAYGKKGLKTAGLKDQAGLTGAGLKQVGQATQGVNLAKKTDFVTGSSGKDALTNVVVGNKNEQPGAIPTTPPANQMAQATTPTAPPPVTSAIPGAPGMPAMPAMGPQAAPTTTSTPAAPGASIAQATTPPTAPAAPGATTAAQSATASTDAAPTTTEASPPVASTNTATDEITDAPEAEVEEDVTASAEPEEEYVPQTQTDEEAKYGGDPFSELKAFVDGEELDIYQLAGETDADELSDEDQEKQNEGVNVAPRKQGEFQYDEDAKWIRDMMREIGYDIQDMDDLGSIQGIDQQSGIPDSQYFADEEATSKWMMSPEGQKWHYENNKQSFSNMGIMSFDEYQDQYISRGNESTMVKDFQSQHAKGALNAWDNDSELRDKMIAAYGDEETAKAAYMQSVTFGDHGKGNPFGMDNKHGVFTQGVSDFKKSPMEIVCIKCSEDGKQISQVFSKKDGCGPGWVSEGAKLDCTPSVEEVRELEDPEEVQPIDESDPEFWLQDQLGLMNAIDNKFRIKKYYPMGT